MFNKILIVVLASSVLFGEYGYNGSTTAVTTLVGGIIKAQHIENNKKYKRKECPICKGTGYYISGDRITKVNCGYCVPDVPKNSATIPNLNLKKEPSKATQQNCVNGVCPTK